MKFKKTKVMLNIFKIICIGSLFISLLAEEGVGDPLHFLNNVYLNVTVE